MKSIAAIYRRVSTVSQAGEDRVSLSDQENGCRRMATADGFTVPDHMLFTDTVSGTLDETERPAFGQMLAAARRGDFSRLYFFSVDRLGRDQAIISGALKDLTRAGVDCKSVRDPDLQNPMLRAVLAGMAEHEANTIRDRTKRGKDAKKAQGLWVMGDAPYGYRKRPDKSLEQDPIEAPILRRIYEMTRNGTGRIAIAKHLNAESVDPAYAYVMMPGRQKERRIRLNTIGGRIGLEAFLEEHKATLRRTLYWEETNLTKLLGKSIYYGELDGRPMRIHPAPIISRQVHDEALAASKARFMRGSNPQKPKLLTGLLRCGHPACGRAYGYHMGGGSSGSNKVYYQCYGRRSGTGCEGPHLRMEDADIAVVEVATEYLTSRLNRGHFYEFLMAHGRGKVDAMQRRLADAQAALSDAKRRRKILTDTAKALMANGAEQEDLADLTAEMRALTPQIDSLQREENELIAELGRTEAAMAIDETEARDAATHAENALWLGPSGDEFERSIFGDPRDVLRMVVRRALVQPDRSISVELDRSDDALAQIVRHLADTHLQSVRKLDELAARRPAVRLDREQDLELQRKLWPTMMKAAARQRDEAAD